MRRALLEPRENAVSQSPQAQIRQLLKPASLPTRIFLLHHSQSRSSWTTFKHRSSPKSSPPQIISHHTTTMKLFKKAAADASSVSSSRDSLADEKNRIASAVDKSGLQFSVMLSSVVHSFEHNDCGHLTLAFHNPTTRYIAFITNGWEFNGIGPSNKSALYQDIANGVACQEPKYIRNLRVLTLDMGWQSLWKRWGLFKDWKRRPKLFITGPGHTHTVFVKCEDGPPQYVTEKEQGLFKWKVYPVTLRQDFDTTQWDKPHFQQWLKLPCDEYRATTTSCCETCERVP